MLERKELTVKMFGAVTSVFIPLFTHYVDNYFWIGVHYLIMRLKDTAVIMKSLGGHLFFFSKTIYLLLSETTRTTKTRYELFRFVR
jgi:hypothetical protein